MNNKSDEKIIVLKEYVANNYNNIRYSIDKESHIVKKIGAHRNYFSLKDLFKNVFLPEGFPHSVSNDYIKYQIWDTIQAFCSSISGALAARAVFESIGVGDENATAYGATLTWLIKDGTGMAGRIVFAWYQGSSLDSNSKMWRLYADIINDLSFFVDLVTPFCAKSLTIYIISLSGLLKSIVGVSGGATRASLTQHQAKSNNLADVCAKDSSQETLVNLVALIFNIFLLNFVKDSKMLIWQLFIVFVIGHILANYNAVKSVIMETFNRNRFKILAQYYIETNNALSPVVVNKKEPVLFEVNRYFKKIDFGSRIEKIKNFKNIDLERFQNEKYFIEFNLRNRSVIILLHESSTHIDYVRCLFQVEIVEFVLSKQKTRLNEPEMIKLKESIDLDHMEVVEKISNKISKIKLKDFIEKTKNENWSYSYTQFSIGKYKYILDSN